MLCYWCYGGVGCVSVGTNTGASVSDGVGVIMDMDRDRGGVLKNGFGILKFAEAPNLFHPRGGIYRGRGAGG